MRVFHLKSSSGSFEAIEVLNPARSDHITPYPILQSQLYSADQPGMKGLMLVGFHNTISAPNFARNEAFTKTETRERLEFR